MRMHIDGPWEDIFTLGVEHCIGLQRSKRSRRGDCDNLLIVDEYVTGKITGCSDDVPISDECTHSYLLLLKITSTFVWPAGGKGPSQADALAGDKGAMNCAPTDYPEGYTFRLVYTTSVVVVPLLLARKATTPDV